MRFFVGLIFCFLVDSVTAQPSITLEEPISWYHNIDDALTVARKEDKHVFLYFSGSDWCKPCIQLKTRIIETDAWVSYANANLIMVQADFPRMKKNQISKEQQKLNEMLAEKYNIQGVFPLVVILSPSGELKGKLTFREESIEAFIFKVRGVVEQGNLGQK